MKVGTAEPEPIFARAMRMSDRMPALFLSHGSPMLALEDEPTTRFLRRLPATLPKPSAIVVASAHWETDKTTVTSSAHPETIHDFHCFPKVLYELRYAVPGDPRFAARLQILLMDAGIASGLHCHPGLDLG